MSVNNKRLGITVTESCLNGIDHLVMTGIFIDRQTAFRDALRLLLRDWRVPPFYPEAIPVESILKSPLEEPIVEPVEPAVKAEPEVSEEAKVIPGKELPENAKWVTCKSCLHKFFVPVDTIGYDCPECNYKFPPKPILPVVQPEPEEERLPEVEFIEPCPNGLYWPLWNLEVCKKCDHYKRKYGESPEACNWKGPIKDIAKEPAEEPIARSEPVEEITDEDDELVMIFCESGAHKPGLIPHRKKGRRHGWAMYTCTKCHKETPMLISKAEGETQNE